MSEDKKGKVFSDAYWNMHRNTLFFSVICLIYSIPYVVIDGNISALGIKVPSGTDPTIAAAQSTAVAQFIAFVALLAAIYSYIAFFLEWREQAYPVWRESRKKFSNILKYSKEKFERRVDLLDEFNKLDGKVQNYKNEIASNFHNESNKRTEDAIGRVNTFYNSAMGGGFDVGEWMDQHSRGILPFQRVEDFDGFEGIRSAQEFNEKMSEVLRGNIKLLIAEFHNISGEVQAALLMKSVINDVGRFEESYNKI